MYFPFFLLPVCVCVYEWMMVGVCRFFNFPGRLFSDCVSVFSLPTTTPSAVVCRCHLFYIFFWHEANEYRREGLPTFFFLHHKATGQQHLETNLFPLLFTHTHTLLKSALSLYNNHHHHGLLWLTHTKTDGLILPFWSFISISFQEKKENSVCDGFRIEMSQIFVANILLIFPSFSSGLWLFL